MMAQNIIQGISEDKLSFETQEHNIYTTNLSRTQQKFGPALNDLKIINNLDDLNDSETGWDDHSRDLEDALERCTTKL